MVEAYLHGSPPERFTTAVVLQRLRSYSYSRVSRLRESRRRASSDPNFDVAECLKARIDAELRRCAATEAVMHRSDHVDVLLDLRNAISEASILHALERVQD